MDEKQSQYLLYFNGRTRDPRTYGCYLHLEVSLDAKVWVHHDGTDLKIAEQLLNQAIPK